MAYPRGQRAKRPLPHGGDDRLEAYLLEKTRPNPGGIRVKNPLDSIWGTVICGFILTGILYYVATLLVSHSAVGGS
jgi:hypothetical protein